MSSSIDNTTTNCAACGKEGPTNTCNKCELVRYCNAACKKKHRSRHKKACDKRVAELHDKALFKEHPPPQECPICFLPLPHRADQTAFKSCCGKIICDGCMYAIIEEAYGRGNFAFPDLCAFCRTPEATSDEETIRRIKKLMEAKNADAFHQLAGTYAKGDVGVPQDMAKANELYLRAGQLGCAGAYYNLGCDYENGRGVEVDEKKAKHFYALAAMNGNVRARQNLGCVEVDAGNMERALKHFLLSARAGDGKSLDRVKEWFMRGFVTKDEYANTLRAYQQRHDEMKSYTRDKAAELEIWMKQGYQRR